MAVKSDKATMIGSRWVLGANWESPWPHGDADQQRRGIKRRERQKWKKEVSEVLVE